MARNQNRLIEHLARPALRWTGFFIPTACCALRSGPYFLSRSVDGSYIRASKSSTSLYVSGSFLP
nr:MAG TPA: hypothetical protein [Caudoviricetes sp.]